MKNERQPTKEETAQGRTKAREIALKNLGAGNLANLAAAYYAYKDKNYGEYDNSAVEKFLYEPSIAGAKAYDLESGKETDLVYDSLLGSRKDGERYSGQISEFDVIKTSAGIIQNSLAAVKVDDVMQLMGSNVKIKDAYKGKYLAELAEAGKAGDEEAKKIFETLITGYLGYTTTQNVSKALGQRAASIRNGLEKIVKEEEVRR